MGSRAKECMATITDYVITTRKRHGITWEIVACGGAAIVGLIAYRATRKRKQYKLPPGPKGWPIIGNLLDLFNPQHDVLTYYVDLHKTYGGIYTLYYGQTPEVVLGTAEWIREAFIRQGDKTSGRPQVFSFHQFSSGGKDIFAAQPHAIWKLQRAIVHQCIRTYGQKLEEIVHDGLDKVTGQLKKETGPFDPSTHLNMLVYSVFAPMLLGKRIEYDDPLLTEMTKVADEFDMAFGGVFMADVFPIFRYVPTAASRELKRTVDEYLGFFARHLKEHRNSYQPGIVTDFTYALLEMERQEASEEGSLVAQLTEEHFVQMIVDVFMAGVDTTRHALRWIILYMVIYPDVQKKIQTEIDEVVGHGGRVRLADRDKLAYMNAAIHEVMRLKPLAPLALTHMATEDVTIGEYYIPANTRITSNIMAAHLNPTDWPEPEVFRPERFLDADGHFVTNAGWLPFSTGKRMCVGEAMAKTELQMFVAGLLQRFTFSVCPGEQLIPAHLPSAFLLSPQPFQICSTVR